MDALIIFGSIVAVVLLVFIPILKFVEGLGNKKGSHHAGHRS